MDGWHIKNSSFLFWYGELSATPFTGMGLEGLTKAGVRRKGGWVNLIFGSKMYDIQPTAQTQIGMKARGGKLNLWFLEGEDLEGVVFW